LAWLDLVSSPSNGDGTCGGSLAGFSYSFLQRPTLPNSFASPPTPTTTTRRPSQL
jgi:hypothetical protein